MISYLKMINWRKYDNRELRFEKGITFLMGENGSGKTSILEAIAYALTGEAALFHGSERAGFLKDPNKPAVVTLGIEVDGSPYEIMRTQNPERAGNAQIIQKTDDKILAQTQAGVTKQVEKLLGSSDDFIRRITYMAEGDVFNFLKDPPKEALDIQIRFILGLTQLDEFAAALTTAEKFLKNRLITLQDLNEDLIRLEVRSLSELENKLKGQNIAREQFLVQLEDIGRELGGVEKNADKVHDFQETINRLKEVIKNSPDYWMNLESSPVPEYFDWMQNKLREEENHLAEIKLVLAKLDGQEEAYTKVFSLLEPFEGSDDTVPCPVCRKPISKSQRKTILEEVKKDVEKINKERASQNQIMDYEARFIKIHSDQVRQLLPLRNSLMHVELPGIHPSQPFINLAKSISDLAEGQQSPKQKELAEKRETIRKRINDLDAYMAEYQAIKNRLRDAGFDSPEELANELVQIEIRMLSLRAASQAIEETLQSQQNIDMTTIYKQIADLWSSFREDDGWKIEYTSTGYPMIISEGEATRLDLRQLSGGEKTALLIMVNTIMAHHFSKSDFLMIDEPLEHLDPINRRSLIKFLVQAYHHRIFGQAIIATFEESLLRKYQSSEGVNIILM